MKFIAIYCRAGDNVPSTDTQLRDLRDYAQKHGLVVVREYIEENTSQKSANQPAAMPELMAAARNKYFTSVLVWRLDRLAKSTRHFLDTLIAFRTLRIGFISYQDNLDTNSPGGQAMFSVVSALARMEHDLLVSRAKAGVANARATGHKLGRRKISRRTRRILHLRDEGFSTREIARLVKASISTVARRLRETKNELESTTVEYWESVEPHEIASADQSNNIVCKRSGT